MKKISLSVFFSLVSIITFAQSLKVVIRQDGKIVERKENIYQLKKAPFQFEFEATNLEGFSLGVTTDGGLYEEAVDFSNKELSWFENTGMAEELYNKEKELLVMDHSPSYWYYIDKNDHRFDRDPKGAPNKWIASRTIKQLYDVMAAEAVDFKNIEGNASIFLLMYIPVYNDDYKVISKKNLFDAELMFTD